MKLRRKNVKLLKQVDGILNNEKDLTLLKEKLKKDYNLYDDYFSDIDNISQYILDKIEILKEYMTKYMLSPSERDTIISIIYLLSQLQAKCIWSIKCNIAKLKDCKYDEGELLIIQNSLFKYQERVDEYMKKLGFNN